ncbi:MAG: TatD family hydrolase [Chloroflexi bacterium]|nr:TatD family hydrolase [Chloroflexota bacterium]
MIPASLVDTHAHVQTRHFDADRVETLERARGAGVGALLCVGYDLPTSRAAVTLARAYPDFARASVGLHPNDAQGASAADLETLEALAAEPEVVAIGETGLDYYRDRSSPARQAEVFAWHLRLAEQVAKPVVVHNRDADADAAVHLERSAARRPSGQPPGVLHCFSSEDPVFLQRMLDAGYFVSIAGPVTFRNSRGLPDVVARVPEDRLVVETDCPYLAPEPHRGRRNEPAYVRHTAERLAQLRHISFDALTHHLWTASCLLFPAFGSLPRATPA